MNEGTRLGRGLGGCGVRFEGMGRRKRERYAYGWVSIGLRVALLVLLTLWGLVIWEWLAR